MTDICVGNGLTVNATTGVLEVDIGCGLEFDGTGAIQQVTPETVAPTPASVSLPSLFPVSGSYNINSALRDTTTIANTSSCRSMVVQVFGRVTGKLDGQAGTHRIALGLAYRDITAGPAFTVFPAGGSIGVGNSIGADTGLGVDSTGLTVFAVLPGGFLTFEIAIILTGQNVAVGSSYLDLSSSLTLIGHII